MESDWCWPSIPEHSVCPRVWFIYPVSLHSRKRFFSLLAAIICKASWLGVGLCAHFPSLMLGFLSGLIFVWVSLQARGLQGFSLSAHCPVADLCINCHLLQEEASLMRVKCYSDLQIFFFFAFFFFFSFGLDLFLYFFSFFFFF